MQFKTVSEDPYQYLSNSPNFCININSSLPLLLQLSITTLHFTTPTNSPYPLPPHLRSLPTLTPKHLPRAHINPPPHLPAPQTSQKPTGHVNMVQPPRGDGVFQRED